MEKRKAIYGGSFDPITYGHMSIINQALEIFDKVIIMVATNPNKNYMFSVDERVAMILSLFSDDVSSGGVEVRTLPVEEVLVEKAYKMDCFVTIRGIRSSEDYTYENELAATNYYIQPMVKTMMLLTAPSRIFVSSSRLKVLVSLGMSPSLFAPSMVIRAIKRKLKEQLKKD